MKNSTSQFGVGLQHLKRKIRHFIFSGKIVTSLAYIFTMKKALVKIILAVKFLFINRFSIVLCHSSFKTFRDANGSHFAGGISKQGNIQKGSFQRMV